MNNTDLQRQVASLTAALMQTSSIDANTRSALMSLQQEVQRLVDHHESVTDRLESLATRFEVDHPAAGAAIRQAIDLLAKAGI